MKRGNTILKRKNSVASASIMLRLLGRDITRVRMSDEEKNSVASTGRDITRGG